MTAEQKAAGIITFSSGNHAGATALAGKLLGIETTIIMPEDAPQIKINATKSYGGHVVFYDRKVDDREEIARQIQREFPGKEIIPPYNHKQVIAGQATAIKELVEEVGDLDYLFVGIGGGSLISGASLVKARLNPEC